MPAVLCEMLPSRHAKLCREHLHDVTLRPRDNLRRVGRTLSRHASVVNTSRLFASCRPLTMRVLHMNIHRRL